MSIKDEDIVERAIHVLSDKLTNYGIRKDFASFSKARDYFRLAIGERKVETFCVMYLDNRYKMLEFEELSTGTVNECQCNARAIAVKALDNCAKFVIVGHNHPSGDCRPSDDDREATKQLAKALGMFDIQVLDHFVVGRDPGLPVFSIHKNQVV